MLGFSGGPDSTGLAVMLRAHDPVLAYVDHRLRGHRAARRERERVRAIAAALGLGLVRARVTVAGPGEAGARRERYRALEALTKKHGCAALATAHSADDRAETILFNLLRGTGLRGLSVPLAATTIRGLLRTRPALDERRAALHAAAAPYEPIRDRTNRSTRWARPRIRHLVLPQLARRLGRDPVPLLCALADRAAQARGVLERRADGLARRREVLLGEPEATFPYLVEAMRAEGPPLTASAYRSLRAFLEAGRRGRAHVTPGGEAWTLGREDRVRVSSADPTRTPTRPCPWPDRPSSSRLRTCR